VILSIGSEILRGEIIDTNAAFLSGSLTRLGFTVLGVRQLPDELPALTDAFRVARGEADLVVASGGLGPTHDDLTREALADALGEALSPDPSLEADLRARFAALGSMPESNLRQALRIPSAEALPNPFGSAPGWWVDTGGITVMMPGPPTEMGPMWEAEVLPRLAARFTLRPPEARVIKTFGVGESALAERLGALLDAPPPGVETGIYAREDGVHIRVAGPGSDELADQIAAACGTDAWGSEDDSLPAVAMAALRERGAATVASHERGTGGSLLTILAGQPAYLGGVLETGDPLPVLETDALIRLTLDPPDDRGRSRLVAAVDGEAGIAIPAQRLRAYGSGPARLRRAGFAALDLIRRA
jgi:nicotinamide-nucleotide amidase